MVKDIVFVNKRARCKIVVALRESSNTVLINQSVSMTRTSIHILHSFSRAIKNTKVLGKEFL